MPTFTRPKLLAISILSIVLLLGGYFVLRNWRAAPATAPSEILPGVPLIDIAKEKMEGAVEFRLSKPHVSKKDDRTATFINVFVPIDINRKQLYATTKNALIALYESIDPNDVRWLEARIYLEGETPDEQGIAAFGVLNHDMQGYGEHPPGKPWQIELRLLDPEKRLATGIDDQKLEQILSARKAIDQTQTALLVEGVENPSETKLLNETSRRQGIPLATLKELTTLHKSLYTQIEKMDSDLL